MPKVSIVCMIYKSPQYADWVYRSVMEFTPMIARGEAEFFFVANDPTDELVKHLKKQGYPFVLALHKRLSPEQLAEKGLENREYLNRVYQAWNQAILYAKGQMVCLLNSDNYVSPDWLENLLKYADFDKFVVPQLVEPSHHLPVFWCALHGEFGSTITNFKKEAFLAFADIHRITGIKYGGVYQPCLFYKDVAIYAGLYPEGNLQAPSGEVTTGDKEFLLRLNKIGIKHITALDSVVYHMGEGEKVSGEGEEADLYVFDAADQALILPQYQSIFPVRTATVPCALSRSKNANRVVDALSIFDKGNLNENSPYYKFMNDITRGKADTICIFCAGGYGKKVFWDMWKHDAYPDYYCDNNPQKRGIVIGDVACVPYETLLQDKEHVFIIVANMHPESIVSQLRNAAFPYVITAHELVAFWRRDFLNG